MTKYVARFCVIALVLSGSILVMSCDDTSAPNTPSPAPNQGSATNTLPPKDPKYGGAVDIVRCDQIGGWVWDSANPYEDIKVDVYVDGKLVSTVPAKNPRPDLRNPGTKNYGFGLKTPPSVQDGQPHTVSVKVAGSNYEIKAWDQIQPTLTCPPK